MYTINYHTGAGDTTADTLDKAMEIADDGACYTQQSISILDENGDEVARRAWSGSMEYVDECENPIIFGTFGFYDDWQ